MASDKASSRFIARAALNDLASEYDGFMTVIDTSEKYDKITEDEGFAVVGARHGYEAFLGEIVDPEQAITKDDYANYTAAVNESGASSEHDSLQVEQVRAMSHQQLVHTVAEHACRTIQDQDEATELYAAVASGAQTLSNTAEEWITSNAPIYATGKQIMSKIRGLPDIQQVHLHLTLGILLESCDWANEEKGATDTHDREISKAFWLLMVGPRGVVIGWAYGLSPAAIALDTEEYWFSELTKTEGQKQIVIGLAGDLRAWGHEMAEML